MSEESHLTEDTVSQSGWVFADLLVALSVVFLATISFIPLGTTSSNSQSNSLSVEPGKLFWSNGFSELYNSIQIENLLSDLEEFRVENGIPVSVPVIHLQFIGSSEASNGRTGILDALEFSLKLQNANLEQFQDLGVTLDVSERVKPGQVLVRAVFGVSKN